MFHTKRCLNTITHTHTDRQKREPGTGVHGRKVYAMTDEVKIDRWKDNQSNKED